VGTALIKLQRRAAVKKAIADWLAHRRNFRTMTSMTKSEIRRSIRERLGALGSELLARKSASICREVAQSQEWAQARTVGLFAPLPSEPDVELLWADLGSRTVCYPRMEGDCLLFLRVEDRSALVQSRWNLREPPLREQAVVALENIDLLLVPGVAFTEDGHRLGRGGGYYDRLLAAPTLRSATFGICFAEQMVPRLPMEAHDQTVGRVFRA